MSCTKQHGIRSWKQYYMFQSVDNNFTAWNVTCFKLVSVDWNIEYDVIAQHSGEIYKGFWYISRLDIWLAMHHSITFLLLPTWYTNFLFIHTNHIKLNSSTCFEHNPLIIRRSTQIVHMQPLVSSLAASDRLVQPLRKDWLVEWVID